MSTASGVAERSSTELKKPTHEESLDAGARQRARAFINQLHVVLKTAHTHEPSNVIFKGAFDGFWEAVIEMHAGESDLSFEVILDDFHVNKDKLRTDLSCYHAFKHVQETLEGLKIGGLSIASGVGRDDLVAAILLMARTDHTAAARAELEELEEGATRLNEQLAAREIETIEFMVPKCLADSSDFSAKDRRKKALKAYEEALSFIRAQMSNFVTGELIDVRGGKRLVQSLVDSSADRPGEFQFAGLASIKNHHPYTFNHIVNVCVLAIAFGQRLGLDRRELCQLGMGALFHDIGKLSVPNAILDKEEPLTDEEWKTIQQHPLYATRHLLNLANMTESGMGRLLVALEHHMAYDLKGYPSFRTTRRTHIHSRIVAVVDAYDAMVSRRAYQDAMLPTVALKNLLKCSGTRFDPILVKAFINCIGLFPVGSLVLLNTGELAVVTAVNDGPDNQHRPLVRLVRSASGRDLCGVAVDLSGAEAAGRIIQKCVEPEEYDVNVAKYTLWKDADAS